jgi:hypothetical protein
MYYAASLNMCSECIAEQPKQIKLKQLEAEMLAISVDNASFVPLLEYRMKPISIKQFRTLYSFVPTSAKKSQDDLIFGVARYYANKLGILLRYKPPQCILDEPLSSTEYKQLWRKATFMCKCSSTNIIAYGVRSFCLSCSYLVPSNNITHMTICPSCNSFESWEQIGAPCLSCQFASIRFQNPFETRLEILINTWLPVSSEMENNNLDDYDDNDDDTCTIAQTIRHPAGKTSQDTLFKL